MLCIDSYQCRAVRRFFQLSSAHKYKRIFLWKFANYCTTLFISIQKLNGDVCRTCIYLGHNFPNYFCTTTCKICLVKEYCIENQWSVPAILLFAKNADYENEKCLKINVLICILPSKEKKGHLFLTSTSRYENLAKVPPFLIKSGTYLGFVFDIKWTNFLE